MDIIIKILSDGFLEKYIQEFIDILKDEPDEYWKEENFRRELSGKFDISMIAIYNNVLVGYIVASIKEEGAYIHKFMTSSQYRSRGIGSRLQHAFEIRVKNLKLQKILLTILAENKNASKFYEKNGYNKIGERIDSINHRTLIIMEKIIK